VAGEKYTVHLLDDGVGVASCGPVFLTQFYGAPTVAKLNRLYEVQRPIMTAQRYAVMTIIDPRVGKDIDGDARHRAKQISNEMEPHTMAMAFVVLGTGFFASMVRSVVAGVQLFSNQRSPWKVVADVNAGVEFVRSIVITEGKAVDVEALQACAARLIEGPKKSP
jgi:hypothetical protein